MKGKIKILLLTLLSVFSLGSAALGSLAWFVSTIESPSSKVKGSSMGAYFAYGEGTSGSPFGINNPRHLYNLAWLQYLGYFNNHIVGPDSGPVYFELDPTLDTDLDMSKFGSALPPIGTDTFPFVGYFNGNGKTITGLTVDNVINTDHITKTPSVINVSSVTATNILKESTGGAVYSETKTVDIMGMFGKTDTINADDTSEHIYDFRLENTTISSSSNQLVVGVAAGYLDSKMSNVAVSSPTITITNTPSIYSGLTNISNYTIVGYATENFVQQGNKKIVDADKPKTDNRTQSGAGSEFGASIPMKRIYNNLLTIHNNSQPFAYDEVWDGVINDPNATLTKQPIAYSNNPTYYLYGDKQKDTSGAEVASYSFVKRTDTNAFMYLYGQDTGTYTKHIDGIAYENAINGGSEFAIGDGEGHWLTYNKGTTLNETYNVTSTNDVNSAQKWKYVNGSIQTSDSKGSHSVDDGGWWGGDTAYHYGYLSLVDDELKVIVRSEEVASTTTKWSFDKGKTTTSETIIEEDGTETVVTTDHPYRVLYTSSTGGDASAYIVYNDVWTVELKGDDYHIFTVGPDLTKYFTITSVASKSVTLSDDQLDATNFTTSTTGGFKFEEGDNQYTFAVEIEHYADSDEVPLYRPKTTLKLVNVNDFDSTLMRPYLLTPYENHNYFTCEFTVKYNTSTGNCGDVTVNEKTFIYFLKINNGTLEAVGGDASANNNSTAYTNATYFETVDKDISQYSLAFQTGSITQQNVTWTSYPTYFPLSYESDTQASVNNGNLVARNVSPKNTGYIVSGSNYSKSGTFKGDIRVSDYSNGSNQLSASLGGNNSYNNLTIVTHERSAGGGYVAIDDNYNDGNVPSRLSGVTSTSKTSEELGLVRYDDSRAELHSQFSADFAHIHGLHFMNAAISHLKTISIPHAHILGQEYENYPMPQDCIDFNLNKNGFITFYAGTYFSGNNTFFSLHEINRNADKSISSDSIKEISKIYDNTGTGRATRRYLYDYVGGGDNVRAEDTKGSLLFDMTWVTSPTVVQNAVYYFEIPVTSGEYALGSVSGKEGAYLMYLDIGSARKNEDITTVTEKWVTTNYLSTYVDGVDFSSSGSSDEIVGGETGNVTIPAGASGTYSFSYSDSTLTYTGSGNLSATHIAEGINVSNNITNGMQLGDTVRVDKTTSVTYNDFDETITTTVNQTTTTTKPDSTVSVDVADPVVTTETNVLSYDSSGVVELNVDGSIVRFRYWGSATFTTEYDYEEKIYTFVFNTSDPLAIYVESLTPGETGITVKFKSTASETTYNAVASSYITLNPTSP